MLRVLVREEDNAAPRVPDDNANAPEKERVPDCVQGREKLCFAARCTHKMCSSRDWARTTRWMSLVEGRVGVR